LLYLRTIGKSTVRQKSNVPGERTGTYLWHLYG
jgi:hypothetical protein